MIVRPMMFILKKYCLPGIHPALWTAYGMGMGTAIGVAIDDLGLGIAIGMLGNVILQLTILWFRKRRP
jgi:hypothetical protein